MMPHYPYFNSSYYRYFPNYSYQKKIKYGKHNISNVNNFIKENLEKEHIKDSKKEDQYEEDRQFFDVLGLKLYYDDILLVSLIFFLYKEEIQDQYLFVCLILLLLS